MVAAAMRTWAKKVQSVSAKGPKNRESSYARRDRSFAVQEQSPNRFVSSGARLAALSDQDQAVTRQHRQHQEQ